LLAFGIEASWESRKEEAVAASSVELLRADLVEAISVMEERNARADSIVEGLEELSRIIDGVTTAPASDSLAILLNYCFSGSTFTPALASYDVLRGGAGSDFVPPDVEVELAAYLEGLAALDLALQVEALAHLVELATEYGGVPGLISSSDRAMSVASSFVGTESGDHAGFVADPRFGSWLWVHLVVVDGERAWRREWIERLGGVLQRIDAS
jgi:hypothetical protein